MIEDNQISASIKYNDMSETSEKILKRFLETHFKTVFVGAVSHFEDEFGFLWGESEDFDEANLSDEQKFFYEKFLNVRDRIFTQGNREKKEALAKLKHFSVMVRNIDNG